ncbi:MAG: sigma-54-dependent transcriptional regulator [Acidobacteriota bacterium]
MGQIQRASRSVLVVEEKFDIAASLRDLFQNDGWDVEWASSETDARKEIERQIFDLVLADYQLTRADGAILFGEVRSRSPLTKIILTTEVHDMAVATEAIRLGAADLILKPFDTADLAARIERLMPDPDGPPPYPIPGHSNGWSQPTTMVGSSSLMKKVFRLISLVAEKDTTVLITGESGTGKELVAKAIHNQSLRRKNPFVAINCGAIPEQLLEDELFGHVRGAYTDARQTRAGRFEQANKGTLFLDEIGNMPMTLQIKLLRVLELREFERLGSNQTVRVDVRVVTATNSDLEERVAKGEFREDLFYRLNVVPIELPPLRHRREDIPLLANHFLETLSSQRRFGPKTMEPAAVKLVMSFDWPGNVRELRNTLEFAAILSADQSLLKIDHFPRLSGISILEEVEEHFRSNQSTHAATQGYPDLPEAGIDLNQVVSDLEKHLICQSLRRTDGNKVKAARLLFLKRTTLVEKLRRMNLLHEFSSARFARSSG